MKQEWFGSLEDALASEGLQSTWKAEFGEIRGNEYVSYYGRDQAGIERLITIYRSGKGLYERPIHRPSNPWEWQLDIKEAVSILDN